MIVFLFIIVLSASIMITNKKNEAGHGEETLIFNNVDSLIIFSCFISSFIFNFIVNKWFYQSHLILWGVSIIIYGLILYFVNVHREEEIQKKHEDIAIVYELLENCLGRIDKENFDYSDVPFVIEYDKKTKNISKIIVDTSQDGKFNDNTIILSQQSLAKMFPKFQWVYSVDYQKRELLFEALPEPPKKYDYPGSNYRPVGWIPLGIGRYGEIGWNFGKPSSKEMGISEFQFENGDAPETVDMPSAYQCLCLGSTGGGKSIFVDQYVEVKK